MNDTLGAIETLEDAVAHAARCNHSHAFAEALASLDRYADGHDGHHWLQFQLGRAHAGLGREEDAFRRYALAAASDYPYRVGALYEMARLDLAAARFEGATLIDEALALPGDIDARDEAAHQKRFYYDRLLFLKALVALRAGDRAGACEHMSAAYRFNRTLDERPFAFAWLLETLAAQSRPDLCDEVEYLRQRLLYVGMTRGLSYGNLLDRVPRGAKALEIGGMDGVRFDPLHAYLKAGAFDAVVVEPVGGMFAALQANYRDCPNVRCAHVAIAAKSGPLPLYRITPETIARHGLEDWVHGIASADKGPVLAYFGDLVTEEVVAGLSFCDFVERFAIERFEILQIDTEGHDWTILRQIDLRRFGVQLANIEIVNLMPADRLAVFAYLESAGYRFEYAFQDVVAVSPSLHAGLI